MVEGEYSQLEQGPNRENKWRNYFESLYDLTTLSDDRVTLGNPSSDVVPPDEESAKQAIKFLKRSLISRDTWEKDGKRGYEEYGDSYDNWAKGWLPKGSENLSNEEKQAFQDGVLYTIEKRWLKDSKDLMENHPEDWRQRFRNAGEMMIFEHFVIPEDYINAFKSFCENKPKYIREGGADWVANYYEQIWTGLEEIREHPKLEGKMDKVFNDSKLNLRGYLIQFIKDTYQETSGGQNLAEENIIRGLNTKNVFAKLICCLGFSQLKKLGISESRAENLNNSSGYHKVGSPEKLMKWFK